MVCAILSVEFCIRDIRKRNELGEDIQMTCENQILPFLASSVFDWSLTQAE